MLNFKTCDNAHTSYVKGNFSSGYFGIVSKIRSFCDGNAHVYWGTYIQRKHFSHSLLIRVA